MIVSSQYITQLKPLLSYLAVAACTDPSLVTCPGETFCCRQSLAIYVYQYSLIDIYIAPGEACSRDADGNAQCAGVDITTPAIRPTVSTTSSDSSATQSSTQTTTISTSSTGSAEKNFQGAMKVSCVFAFAVAVFVSSYAPT